MHTDRKTSGTKRPQECFASRMLSKEMHQRKNKKIFEAGAIFGKKENNERKQEKLTSN